MHHTRSDARRLFTYRAFGLTLSSELVLPELIPLDEPSDVQISLGRVPERLDEPLSKGVLFEASRDNYLLSVKGIARYWVRSGREVIIDSVPDAGAAAIRTYLLGSVMTALLHQRGALALHASGIASPHGAVLFAGASGHGKSTLMAALAERGYQVMADDVAAIVRGDDGETVVMPGFPHVRLWKDAALRLGYRPSQLQQTRFGIEKYSVRIGQPFSLIPRPLKTICILSTWNQENVGTMPISPQQAFAMVRKHTRNIRVLEGLQMQASHFELAAAVASKVPLLALIRPLRRDSISELIERIEPLLQGS